MNGSQVFRLYIFLLVFGTIVFSAAPAPLRAAGPRVCVIPVSGEVNPVMASFIKRALRDAGDPDFYVFKINTFGGRVDAALDIVDIITAIPGDKTIAFVDPKAISAGALIALSCGRVFMRPGSTIGDCAPISFSSEGPRMMGEKFQSPLRARFRSLARRNNYPPALAEAMVSLDMEVYKVVIAGKTLYLDDHELADLPPAEHDKISLKKTVVPKGELLTMDDAEALDLGFSTMTASGLMDILRALDITDYQIKSMEQNWSETLGRFITGIAPVLLMIGLAALYMEIKAPGFGLPGIIGITCLGLVFLQQYMVGLADYPELILAALGIVLLGFEVFVLPGFGIAGIAGLLCLGIAVILSFQNFVLPDPGLPWQQDILTDNIIMVLGSMILAFILSLFLLRYMLPWLAPFVKGPYLSSSLSAAHAGPDETRMLKPGRPAVAATTLRPAGKIMIADKLIDAVTEGEFIEQGTRVIISDIHGNRITVKRDER